VASRPVFVVRAQAFAVAAASGGGGSHPYAPQARTAPAAARAPREETGVRRFPAPVPAAPALDEAEPDLAFPVPAPRESPPAGPQSASHRPPFAEPVIPIKVGRETGTSGRRARHARPRAGSAARRLPQLVVALLLAGAGVAAGHYAMMRGVVAPLAVHPAVEPLDPRLVGGLIGVILAWPAIRWISPRR
jgi:hypothetical protein